MAYNPITRRGWPYFWKIDRWQGGQSEDTRIGLQGAFRDGQGLDIRSDTGLLKIANRPVRDDDGTVFGTSTINWIEPKPSSTDVFFYAGDKIYKRSGGVYTVDHTITSDSPAGQGLCEFNGKLYYRSDTKLGVFDYTTYNDALQTGLTSSTWGPMCRFNNYLMGGHGRYVFALDDVGTFTLKMLTLPPGRNVRHMFVAGTSLVILATRGLTVTESDEGAYYTWGGKSLNYDTTTPIDGNPHAGVSMRGRIWIVKGIDPVIASTQGGEFIDAQGIPNTGVGTNAEVYPGAMTMWRNMMHFGISAGTSTTIRRGTYSYGSKNSKFPIALNPEFPISTGRVSGTTIQITAVKKVGLTLYIGWKDTAAIGVVGVDVINLSQFQTTALYRSLAFDHGEVFTKNVRGIIAEFAYPLASGEGVAIKLSGNPYADPTYADATTYYTGSTNIAGDIGLYIPTNAAASQFKSRDLQMEITLTGPGTTTPSLKRVWVDLVDDPDQMTIGEPGKIGG